MNEISIKKLVNKRVAEVVEQVKAELKENGFGTLTDIDLKEKFKEKLDLDYSNYRILGACNPEFARKVLDKNKSVGLFLPCSIVVYEDGEDVFVEMQKPTFMSRFFEDNEINDVAQEVENRLKQVIKAIK